MYPQRIRDMERDMGRDMEAEREMEIERELTRLVAETTCRCGDPIIAQPSWKPKNSGRRFLGCRNWRVSVLEFDWIECVKCNWRWMWLFFLQPNDGGGCGYFYWFDPPMCRRSKQIIPGLLRKKNAIEVKYKNALYVTWALFALVMALVIAMKVGVGCWRSLFVQVD